MSDLRIALCELEHGRFKDIVHALKVNDFCGQCDFFNLSINDPGRQYRCHVTGCCPAATLHSTVVARMNYVLGWIDEGRYMKLCGVSR